LDKRLAVLYAAELVLALETIHSHCIMHRDMKPNNVMIGDDGHLRIIDFGEAKEFNTEMLTESTEQLDRSRVAESNESFSKLM